jgi:hypothetical protein
MAYISYAANGSTFEFLIVQFVDGDLEVSSSLEFDKSGTLSVDSAYVKRLGG